MPTTLKRHNSGYSYIPTGYSTSTKQHSIGKLYAVCVAKSRSLHLDEAT